jgi:hypothetical protein
MIHIRLYEPVLGNLQDYGYWGYLKILEEPVRTGTRLYIRQPPNAANLEHSPIHDNFVTYPMFIESKRSCYYTMKCEREKRCKKKKRRDKLNK